MTSGVSANQAQLSQFFQQCEQLPEALQRVIGKRLLNSIKTPKRLQSNEVKSLGPQLVCAMYQFAYTNTCDLEKAQGLLQFLPAHRLADVLETCAELNQMVEDYHAGFDYQIDCLLKANWLLKAQVIPVEQKLTRLR